MTKTNKEKVIKKVRKQADVIGTKLATLQKEATYDMGYTDGYITAKSKTKERYEIGIFIVVLAILTALAIYVSIK